MAFNKQHSALCNSRLSKWKQPLKNWVVAFNGKCSNEADQLSEADCQSPCMAEVLPNVRSMYDSTAASGKRSSHARRRSPSEALGWAAAARPSSTSSRACSKSRSPREGSFKRFAAANLQSTKAQKRRSSAYIRETDCTPVMPQLKIRGKAGISASKTSWRCSALTSAVRLSTELNELTMQSWSASAVAMLSGVRAQGGIFQ
mmetsp:Transcript_69113/g.175659  ORF Transcript_69113/g.175659 Transcript_69113/m.175659 type:complete len:202 (-) Transcript_69113:49-654(-)